LATSFDSGQAQKRELKVFIVAAANNFSKLSQAQKRELKADMEARALQIVAFSSPKEGIEVGHCKRILAPTDEI